MEENKECRQCANPNEKGLHTCVDRTELVESIKKIQQEIYEKKYYTPEIKEFYVGFEYEVEDLHDNLVDKMWRKEECYDVPVFLREWIQQGEVRVKYLDREDIESLGFEVPQGGLDYIYKKNSKGNRLYINY
jgi:hypothetical protein